MEKEDRVSGARVLSLAAINAPRFSLYYPSIFHAMSALSAPAGHLPLEWKAAIRDYHPLSPFPRSRFTALQEGSLYFGRDDV